MNPPQVAKGHNEKLYKTTTQYCKCVFVNNFAWDLSNTKIQLKSQWLNSTLFGLDKAINDYYLGKNKTQGDGIYKLDNANINKK